MACDSVHLLNIQGIKPARKPQNCSHHWKNRQNILSVFIATTQEKYVKHVEIYVFHVPTLATS